MRGACQSCGKRTNLGASTCYGCREKPDVRGTCGTCGKRTNNGATTCRSCQDKDRPEPNQEKCRDCGRSWRHVGKAGQCYNCRRKRSAPIQKPNPEPAPRQECPDCGKPWKWSNKTGPCWRCQGKTERGLPFASEFIGRDHNEHTSTPSGQATPIQVDCLARWGNCQGCPHGRLESISCQVKNSTVVKNELTRLKTARH